MGSPEDPAELDQPPLPAPDEDAGGAPDWVVTFADLMSLLLCFFVLLLSFSRMDQEQFKEVAGSLRDAFGVQRQVPAFDIPRGLDLIAREFNSAFTAELVEELRSTVERLKDVTGEGLSVTEDGRGIRITMEAGLLFRSGGADLQEAGKETLQALLPVISEFDGEIHIEGHSDSRPFRRESASDFNWQLSYARALAVLRFFADPGTLAVDRLVPIGRGPSKPVASNLTDEGRAKNRRVELALIRDVESEHAPRRGIAESAGKLGPAEAVSIGQEFIPEARFSPLEFPGIVQSVDLFPE